MTKSEEVVTHLLRRILRDPRLAYYFDPLTESFELLTAAYAETRGEDVDQVRANIKAQMRFERPQSLEA